MFKNTNLNRIYTSVFLGRQRNMSAAAGREIIAELQALPKKIERILADRDTVRAVAAEYTGFRDFLYMGRKYNYPIAYEGALKLKEVSYVHAEGYGAGEMKHGPLAMIDERFPTIAICLDDSLRDKMVSNVREIKARKGRVIAVVSEGDDTLKGVADSLIRIPRTLEPLSPILSIVPLQLFAYYFAVEKDLDVDRPRNLAKSVTVE